MIFQFNLSLGSFADVQKTGYSALVLAMVFSTGEALPLQYYGKYTACSLKFHC